jgi:hypothetical protein
MSDKQERYNTRLNPATQPTEARPGSEEKLRVMAERLARGEQLFHADDMNLRCEEGGHSLKWSFGDGIVVQEVSND